MMIKNESVGEQTLREAVMVVKLVSGETVVGTLIDTTNQMVSITHPFKIESSYEIAPYCPYTKNRTFVLAWNHIVFIKEASDAVIKNYTREIQFLGDEVYEKLVKEVTKDLPKAETYH